MTDDTVLEEHNEDPSLVQMRLIGDGGSYIYNLSSNFKNEKNLMIEKKNTQ